MKKSLAVVGITIAVAIALLFLSGGYGLVTLVEFARYPFLKITETHYHSPKIPEYAVTDFRLNNIQPISNSPFVIFQDYTSYSSGNEFLGYKTGLYNLETKDTVILAHNSMPANSTMLSPDGKNIIYVVYRGTKEDKFINNLGWKLHTFDVYIRELSTGRSFVVSNQNYPFWYRGSIEPNFGWVNNDRIYYGCSKTMNGGYVDYCFTNIRSGEFKFLPRDIYTLNLPQEVSLALDREKQLNNSTDGRVLSQNPSKTEKIVMSCEFKVYDGCGIRTANIEQNGEDKFLYNIGETPYQLIWPYDNQLFGLLYFNNQTHIFKLI